jgi:hypothetical protein
MTKEPRDADSLGWSNNHGGFRLVSRYEDVCAVVREPSRFSNLPGVQIPALEAGPPPPAAL